MVQLTRPLRTLLVNLDRDTARLAEAVAAFSVVDGLRIERVPGVAGSALPLTVRQALTGLRNPAAGALGCFLSHVAAWERVAAGADWGLVVEDDARPDGLERLFSVDLPPESDLVFLNQRANPRLVRRGAAVPLAFPAELFLTARAVAGGRLSAPGTDGYLLRPGAARRLLRAVGQDGHAGDVDWRLMRYAVAAETAARLVAGTAAESVPALRQGSADRGWHWAVVSGLCLSPGLVRHAGKDSARAAENRRGWAGGPAEP